MLRKQTATAIAIGLVAAPAALAQKPPKAPKPGAATSVTIDAKPNPVVFGSVTTISGKVSGGGVGGVAVRLEQDTTAPLGDKFTPAGVAATTAPSGNYSIPVKPSVNTQYRVVAVTSPNVTSPARLVNVRMLVGIRVSDSTPRAGSLVRFSGTVVPAHDGRTALVQRRSSTGRFVTVARTALRDAGETRSSYSRRVRVRTDGVYRVKVSGDADHVNGFSRERRLDVG